MKNSAFTKFMQNSHHINNNDRDIRRIIMINLINIMMIIVFVLFLIVNIVLLNDYFMGYLLVSSALIIGAVITYFHKTNNIKITSWLTLIVMIATIFISISHVKGADSSFIWLIVISPIAYFLVGRKGGIVVSSVCVLFIVLLVSLLFAFDEIPTYTLNIQAVLNIIMSTLVVAIMIYYYESGRIDVLNKLEQQNKLLTKLSTTDKLTGLYNRLKLDEILERELNMIRTNKSLLSIIMTDIDDFKKVNDQYGHLQGDKMLEEIASALRKLVPKQCYVGRWGGEEFLFICPNMDYKQTQEIAISVKKSLIYYFEEMINITMSYGITSALSQDTIETIIRRADQALYNAKNAGKNEIVISK